MDLSLRFTGAPTIVVFTMHGGIEFSFNAVIPHSTQHVGPLDRERSGTVGLPFSILDVRSLPSINRRAISSHVNNPILTIHYNWADGKIHPRIRIPLSASKIVRRIIELDFS